jgi:methylase of polypeptide subunit release factors
MSVKNYPPLEVTLDSGIVVNYPPQLDGGGLTARFDFLDIISKLGKKHKNAFEWCAGFGIIGFELLGSRVCENIYFSDSFELAISNCLKVAKDNNISDQVFAYVSPTIKDIPPTELWDLVVANPPHCFDLQEWKNVVFGGEIEHSVDWDVSTRLGVDDKLLIHREFFENITPRLADDADIFLSEAGISDEIVKLATQNGLVHIASYDNVKTEYGGQTLHFKVKKIT